MKRRFVVLLICLICIVAASMAESDYDPENWEQIPEKLELIPLESSAYRIYQVKGMNRLVESHLVWQDAVKDSIIENLSEVLNSTDPHIPVYFYYVESSRSHPMEKTFHADSELYLHLKELFHADGFDHLKYTTFEQFCKYFFSTDHHWNYRGAYQGYKDIVRMLKGKKEKVLKPAETVVFPVVFNGTYSKYTKKNLSRERFTVYRFDSMPKYTAYAKGKRISYDRMKQYFKGKYNKKEGTSHYSLFYGGDYGKILFKSESKGKGNLLVFNDSVANAVKTLLIGHYDQILFIDLRHYEEETGSPCSFKELISEFHPDQILVLTCNSLLINKTKINP